MPAEILTEAGRMATAGAVVASVVVPFGLIMGAVVLRRRLSLVPRWKPWRVPWDGFEVLAAFLVVMFLIPLALLKYGHMTERAVVLVAFPIQFAALVVGWRILHPGWKPFRRDLATFKSEEWSVDRALPVGAAFCRAMTLSVVAWAVLTPVVLLVYGGVVLVFHRLDLPTEDHPLTKLGGGLGWEKVMFLAQACVAAPIIEELVFRGVLLSWVIGARDRASAVTLAPPVVPPAARPLIVMGVASIYAADSGKVGPVILAGVLALGLVVLWATVRRGKRHVRGIYATAALFAVVHSSVWPSPIPLFFLGLGLGWLAVRTRGVFVPVIVHGLFNAVSAVYVLRGAA